MVQQFRSIEDLGRSFCLLADQRNASRPHLIIGMSSRNLQAFETIFIARS